MAKLYCDGYTLYSNPSPKGGGYVVNIGDEYEHTEMDKTGLTNNEAELMGALRATELAQEGDTIITDSMNTYWWIMKCKCKARPDLLTFARQANKNIRDKKLTLIQEPRETNRAGNYIEFVLQK